MTTLADYYTGVADNIPTTYTMDTASVYRAINRARRRVARQSDATLTTTPLTVAGTFTINTQSYAFPTVNSCVMKFIMETYYYMGNLRIPTNGSLPRLPVGSDLFINFNGWPLSYNLLNEHILYYPIPSFAYVAFVKGKLEPVDLVLPATVDLIIPEPYQDAVIFAAARYTALLDANIELAKAMEQLYQIELGQLPRNYM